MRRTTTTVCLPTYLEESSSLRETRRSESPRRKEQEDSSSDRDTHFNPDSSPKLPAARDADADRTAQAEFEEAVADGLYLAGPDFEWEPGDAGS